jgi:uncharacterized membrane protein YfcA
MIEILGVPVALDYRLALVVVAALVGGLIRGFAGFGSALLIVPALTLTFSAREAIAIELILELPVILALLPAAVRDAERRTVGPMILCLLLAVPIGALALVFVDDATMKIAISIVVLLMVVVLAMQKELTSLIGRRGAIAGAIASGVIQGGAGVGGPPGVIALLALGHSAVVSRANVIAFMTAMLIMTLLSFAAYGFLTREALVLGLIVSPALLVSVFIGMAAFKRYGNRWLRSVARVVVALTALITLGTTVAGLG